MQPLPYQNLLDVMLRAIDDALPIIHAGAARRASLVWETKGVAEYLSEVDTGAEARIRDRLLRVFPEAQVLGEEEWKGERVGDGLCFVVDPLDGTTNFLHGVPEYAVSIGALEHGTLVAGVLAHGARDERFVATRGGGAWRSDAGRSPKRITVSTITEPIRALIATGFPYGVSARDEVPRYLPQAAAVMPATAGIRRAGSAALDLASVACGRYEAFWELSLAPWDIAAGLLLVREAGGLVTDLDGREAEVTHGPFVAGNPTMHAWLLDTIRSAAHT